MTHRYTYRAVWACLMLALLCLLAGISRASQPLLHAGLTPGGSDDLRACGIVSARISQVIGNARASAGTHAQDGLWGGKPYGAAVDISVRNPSAWDQARVRVALACLAMHHFAAYYRWPGHDGWPAIEQVHIHAVRTVVPMKPMLQTQIHDWLNGRDGLAHHRTYSFWQPDQEMKNLNRSGFLSVNPVKVP